MLSITQENPEKGLFALWSLKIENILLQTTQIYMFFQMHIWWVLVEKFFQLDFAD